MFTVFTCSPEALSAGLELLGFILQTRKDVYPDPWRRTMSQEMEKTMSMVCLIWFGLDFCFP